MALQVRLTVECAPKEEIKTTKYTFRGKDLFINILRDFEEPGALEVPGEECVFRLDAKQSPKHLDISAKELQSQAFALGIYEIKGDQLKICTRDIGSTKGRPTEFATKPGSELTLIVFKKKK